MNTNIPYVIKTNGSVTLYLSGECMTVATDHPNYNKIIEALKSGEYFKIENLVNVAKAVIKYASGQISIENGQIFYGGFAVHNTLTDRIIKMMGEGFKFDHMVKFLENLMQNPSNRAVNETYTFLENYGLPITDDGCFLAYKAVRNDYKDIYSGRYDNNVGAAPSMPRNMVDETYDRDCSTGLHVGALDYVVQYGHFVKGQVVPTGGNRLMLVKVNPKDVVSVPKYDNHPKMRVSQYLVVSEIKDVVKELDKVVYTSNAENLEPDYNDDWDDDNDEDIDSCPWTSEEDENNDSSSVNDIGVGPYDEGFHSGRKDIGTDLEYGTNRDYTRKGDYLKGYNDGYNEREYNSPSNDEDNNCCNGGCACGNIPETEDAEYSEGYRLGTSDYENLKKYEESLKPEHTTLFKSGYHDGWVDSENAWENNNHRD
jgi:hypothetical protein